MDKRIDDEKSRDVAKARSFLLRVSVFMAPVALLFLIGEMLLWNLGENQPVAHVAAKQLQSTKPTLYSRNLMSQQFGIYKLAGIQLRSPEILVVGSSRVMQFRDFMFTPLERSFYNAGGIIQGIYDIESLAALIAEGKIAAPRLLVIGIDPWWLRSDDSQQAAGIFDSDDAYNFAGHVKALRSLVRRSLSGELAEALRRKRQSRFGDNKLGLAAIHSDSGFRNDGSRQYAREIVASFAEIEFIDREDPPVIDRIRGRIYQFAIPTVIDDARVSILLAAIGRLVASGVEVWAVMPPFAEESLAAIRGDAELNQFWNDYETLFPMLSQQGANTISMDQLGVHRMADEYMIDGFHPGEVYCAHFVLAMIEQAADDSLLKRIDARKLRQRIESAELPLAFGAVTD